MSSFCLAVKTNESETLVGDSLFNPFSLERARLAMRQLLQVTFQAVTKNSKLTPEFLNSLFIITFLQVAVFGHYYQHSQRPHLVTASYEAQDEMLPMNQPYETMLKEVLPLLSIYFTEAESQGSFYA